MLATALASSALAQKIVCWKDKAGKVVGCGDSVPPEYQDAATREIDAKSGLTRKTTGTAEEEARRAAEAERMKQQKEEEKRKQADQRRRDQALLDTYLNEGEIDRRRDRELADLDRLLTQFQGMHQSAVTRHADAAQRLAAAEKAGKPSDALKEEVARVEDEKTKIERGITAREKEREDIRARYDETKRRYLELKGGGAKSAAAPAPAPAKK
jgi:chromosome segregation ATPase